MTVLQDGRFGLPAEGKTCGKQNSKYGFSTGMIVYGTLTGYATGTSQPYLFPLFFAICQVCLHHALQCPVIFAQLGYHNSLFLLIILVSLTICVSLNFFVT